MRNVTGDKDKCLVMIKRSIYQGDITFTHIYIHLIKIYTLYVL